MSVYQRKDGRWQVSYRDENGKVKTKTTGKGKSGKREAEKFHAQVLLAKAEEKPIPETRRPGIYLDQICQEWVDYKKSQGRELRWLREWVHVFNKYILGHLTQQASQITQSDILRVINNKWGDSSQCTRNRYTGYLKSIFEYAVEQGGIEKNPLGRWKKGKEPARKSMLTYEQLLKIKSIASPHISWAIECAWNIPCRPGDLYELRYDKHYKPEKKGFEVFHRKVGKWSFIHCSDEFLEKVEKMRHPVRAKKQDEHLHIPKYLIEYKGTPVKRIRKALARTAEKLGFEAISPYDIRHCWITTAIDNGVELSSIAYMCGTSVDMLVQNYYQPHSAEQKRTAEIMPKMFELAAIDSSGEVAP